MSLAINSVRQAICWTGITGCTPALASKYPDLEADDLEIAEQYLDAYESRGRLPDQYQNARRAIIERIRQIKIKLENPAASNNAKLKLFARLIDFKEIMRKTNVAPELFSSEEVAASWPAAEIPDAVKEFLDVRVGKTLFVDYVARNVKRVFWTPRLMNKVKILDSDRWDGTSEEISRSVLIDTYDEAGGRDSEPWELAATLVHEAAHIRYFYLFGSDPGKHSLVRTERFAWIVEGFYLSGLYFKIMNDITCPEETRQKIGGYLVAVKNEMEEYNRELGFDPDDYGLDK